MPDSTTSENTQSSDDSDAENSRGYHAVTGDCSGEVVRVEVVKAKRDDPLPMECLRVWWGGGGVETVGLDENSMDKVSCGGTTAAVLRMTLGVRGVGCSDGKTLRTRYSEAIRAFEALSDDQYGEISLLRTCVASLLPGHREVLVRMPSLEYPAFITSLQKKPKLKPIKHKAQPFTLLVNDAKQRPSSAPVPSKMNTASQQASVNRLFYSDLENRKIRTKRRKELLDHANTTQWGTGTLSKSKQEDLANRLYTEQRRHTQEISEKLRATYLPEPPTPVTLTSEQLSDCNQRLYYSWNTKVEQTKERLHELYVTSRLPPKKHLTKRQQTEMADRLSKIPTHDAAKKK